MQLHQSTRTGRARGIARFLADHQHHDAGFDVSRDEGAASGRLVITCKDCGDRVEYQAGEAADFVAANATERPAGGRRPAAADAAPTRTSRKSRPSRRRVAVPSWLPTAAIGMVVGAGLLLLGIAVLSGSGSKDSPGTAPSPSTVATAPTVTQPPPPPPQPQPAATPAAPTLHPRTFVHRFRIGVARGWRAAERDGAITLTAPGSVAEIDVYFATEKRAVGELGQSAARFLAQRHPSGHITPAAPTRIGGLRALKTKDVYPGGVEVALVLVHGGVTYVILQRIERGAPANQRRRAEAQLQSFRPL